MARQLENETKCLVDYVRGKSITEDHLDGSIRNLSASIQASSPKMNRRRSRRRLDLYRMPSSN